MSDDDINQLTPDDGDVDEVIVARLRSALLDDVEVTDRAKDQAVQAVLAQLDNDSPTTVVTELSSRRRNRMNSWQQVAAAVVLVAIGAGVVAQLQTGGDDALELSVKQSATERAEGDFSLALDAASDEDSSGGANPEVQSAEQSDAFTETVEAAEEMAVEEEARAELAVETAERESIRVDDLPTLITELLTERRSSIPINNVCAVGEGELLQLFAEVVVDGELISIVRGEDTDNYFAVNLSTCEVLADIETSGQ